MKARTPFRSLFTTTSVAALLVASSGALADTIINTPADSYTIDFDTDYVSIETTLSNDVGIDGLVITDSGTDVYSVYNSNTGVIDVSDDAEELDGGYGGGLNGILVTNDADVSQISNNGSITVSAQTTDLGENSRRASGIRAEAGSYVGEISNSGGITVTGAAHNVDLSESEDDSSIYTSASAFGVESYEGNYGFYNSGSIVVDATGETQTSAREDTYGNESDAEALSYTSTDAYAVGASFYSEDIGYDDEYDLPNVVGDIEIEDGSITVRANASGFTSADANTHVDASCTVEESCTADAGSGFADSFGEVHATAYGVRADGHYSRTGSFENWGDIDVVATSRMTGIAQSSADGDAAIARTGAHRDYYDIDEGLYTTYTNEVGAVAVGVSLDALEIDGDVENFDSIYAGAFAHGQATADANGTYVVSAEVGFAASADAKGVDIDTLLMHGGFTNEGRIEAASGVYLRNEDDEFTPLVARARSDDDARAETYVYGSSRATGVEIDAHSMTGNFHTDGDNEEDGVYATATLSSLISASANSTASDSSESYAYSDSGARLDAHAIGINLNIGSVAGQVVNDGLVTVLADLYAEQYAFSNSYDESRASADASVYATAIGFGFGAGDNEDEGEPGTIAGNFINRGEIDVTANAYSLSEAYAEGSGLLSADVGNEVYVAGTGLYLYADYIQDNFRSEGNVTVSLNAQSVQNATAMVDDESDGYAYASSGGFDSSPAIVSANGTGLDLFINQISGYIYNDANIQVDVTASLTSTVTADSGDYGPAVALVGGDLRAEASGIYLEIGSAGTGLEWVDDVEEGDGTFANFGLINSNAAGHVTQRADATADDGAALALSEFHGTNEYEDGDADVSSYGVFVTNYDETAYFAGSIGNLDDVHADSLLTVDLDADASVDEGDEEDTRAWAGAGGYYSAGADGFHIEDASVDGEFYNDAEITADALVQTNVWARAVSDESAAFAEIGASFYPYEELYLESEDTAVAHAHATGLTLRDVYFEDDVSNDGRIVATAEVTDYAKAEARGDEYASALIIAGAEAFAKGIEAYEVEIGGTFLNRGFVGAGAFVDQEKLATADGDDAYAEIGSEDDEASWTYANSTGIDLRAVGSFTFDNQHDGEFDFEDSEDDQGIIYVMAGARSDNYAHADATDETSALLFHDDTANATGINIRAYGSEEYTASVTNSGFIGAFAFAGAEDERRQEAYAESNGGDALAVVGHGADADALGGFVAANEFTNSGLIGAMAEANASAYAHADADGGDATAYAYASASAEATGLSVRGLDISSTFSNSGTISGWASASGYARAEATAEGDEYTTAEASAQANAIGVRMSGSSVFDTFTNELDGLIEAHATARASESENEEEGSGNASAEAIGLSGDYTGFVTLQNDGTINATASAEEYAFARGISLSMVSYPSVSGEIVNTGTISASATSDDPFATGIHFDEGVYVNSIRNSGSISAAVFGMDEEPFDGEDGRAIAIDIRGAGQGVTIEQLDGSIVGDVRMENALADYLDWSGGTISGDIYGDQEDDHMNIFVGEGSQFIYHGTIDGLDTFNINGGDYDDDILVRVTNTVRNVNSFNVGPNAILNLGTHAEVTTGDLNLDASSMLVFDLTSAGVNGVINTTTADLGNATVKANFIDPWLPDSQVYRIINWDGDSETRFGSVISSSLLEKVVAEYGDEGVDLLATRLKFADLTGLEDDATSFGLALDRIFDDIDPDSELGQAIMLLIQLTPDQFAYAMSQIAGQQIADVQHVTLSQLGSLIHVIQTQINEARNNLAGDSGANGVSLSFGSDKLRVSSSGDMPKLAGVSAGDETVKGDWSAWARVFGDWAKLDASGTAQGFTANSGGVVIGGDYAVNDALTLGLAGGYQTSSLDFGTGGEGDVDGWSVTAYGDYKFGNAYIDALVGYAGQSYDMNRYLTVLGTNYIANSAYDGSAIIGAVEAGYTFTIAPATTLTPFVGLNGNQTKTDASVETGAGIWNLAYDDRSETRIDTVLGARVSKTYTGSDGLAITPTFELGWKHGFGNDAPTANASLAGTPGTQFQIFGSPTSRDTAIIGAALQVQMNEKVDLYVQYNGQYSSEYSDNTASLRLRWKF